jgi:PAS domain S-box-containing protein
MDQHDDEQRLLQSVATENAKAILSVRRRAEQELVEAKEALELKTRELSHSLALLRATLDCTTDGILVTDKQGNVTDFNEQYLAMWRLPRDAVTSGTRRGILEAMALQVADTRAFLDRIDAIYLSLAAETVDVLHLADGRVFEWVSRPLVVDACNVGRVWSFRDVSDSRRAHDALGRLASIVESSDDAIVGKTLEGIITAWNGGAERIFGYTAAEAVGQHITLIIPAERRAEENEVLARLRRGERIDHFETVRQTKDGRRVDISLTVSPIRDADGRIIGASKVARDITEGKRAQQEREQLLAREKAARAQAEAAGRARDEFLATLSHELRTPLTAMLGWARLLRSGQLDDAGARRALEVIERNAESQRQLIADLLDMSRIIAGKMTLSVRRVNLASIVQDALDIVRPTAVLKGVEFVVALEPEFEVVWGDPDRLQQVMWNLLVNAVKFTAEGGRVSTGLTYRGGRAIITVTDTGKGIRAEVLPYIFDRFRQADSSATRSPGGLGLGLAIVRNLVDLHGGAVRATSEGEGRGATFTVELPVGVYRGRDADQPAFGGVLSTEGVAAPSKRLAGVRALIVDDSADTCGLFKVILELQGADATWVTSAYDAEQAIENRPPDVVICDLGMPGRDGWEFMQHVRNRMEGKNIPAVAVTAFAREEDRERALTAGFHGYLAKPVEPMELIELVAKVVQRGCGGPAAASGESNGA